LLFLNHFFSSLW